MEVRVDYKESLAPKNWCFWTIVLESPLDYREIKLVNPKGNQSCIFIERTDPLAETPILWPPDAKTDSLEKTLMLGKIEGRRRREATEDEMVWWHHQTQSVKFSHSVMSDSLRPHELQHARPPCPSPTSGVHSNWSPSNQWCHLAISSSVVPFSSCPQSLPASVFFNESTLHIRWPQYWSFSFSISPSKNT